MPSEDAYAPEHRKLTSIQAQRLGDLNGIAPQEIAGLSLTELRGKFLHLLDPRHLFFRKVCGRVVKRDPVLGHDAPVPFATVHVEDTDFSLLGYFPRGSRWAWYFPWKRRREVIATTTTDACGNFCVRIPHWDIDWILRFRSRRICFPIAFERPTIREILEERGIKTAALRSVDRETLHRTIENTVGRDAAERVRALETTPTFGAEVDAETAILDAPAFGDRLAPRLPRELRLAAQPSFPRRRGTPLGEAADAPTLDIVRSTLEHRLGQKAATFKNLDLRRPLGPFKRCLDIPTAEWTLIHDVPDITFRVTQDTDGDGTQETIYSEGFFAVRWNDASPGPVTLYAQPNAVSGVDCGPELEPGGAPAIVLAGFLPVVDDSDVFDETTGYATKTNRPRRSGGLSDLPRDDAETPFAGTFSLFGYTNPSASHYRVTYRYSANSGATWTPSDFTPFRGRTWNLTRLVGGASETRNVTPDADGWYENTPTATPAFLPQNLLMNWPTAYYPNGRYLVRLEFKNAAGALPPSDEVAFTLDNSAPLGPLKIEWRFADETDAAYRPIPDVCPVLDRGGREIDLLFRVTLAASAAHLNAASLGAIDCGGGSFLLEAGSGPTAHWHTTPSDNDETLSPVWRLPAAAQDGTYGFHGTVSSRAFNPSGHDNLQNATPPWHDDQIPPIVIYPTRHFSVVGRKP